MDKLVYRIKTIIDLHCVVIDRSEVKIVTNLEKYMQEGNEAFSKGDYASAKKLYGYGFDRAQDELNREIFRFWYALSDLKLGNYILALRNFQITEKNFELLEQMKYPYKYNTYYSLAAVYEGLGQWLNVREALEKALETDHVKQNPDKKMFVLWYIGDTYRETEVFKQAWKCYNEVKDYFKDKNMGSQVLNIDIDIAKLLLKESKVKEALELMRESWRQITSSEEYNYLRNPAIEIIATLALAAILKKIEDPTIVFKIVGNILYEEFSQAETEESMSKQLDYLGWLTRLSTLVGDMKIFEKAEVFTEHLYPQLKKIRQSLSLDDLKNLVYIYMNLGHYFYDQITSDGPNLISFKALDNYKKMDQIVDIVTGRLSIPRLRREYHSQFTPIAYRIFGLYQQIYQEFWEDFLYEGLGIVEKYKGYDLYESLEAISTGRQEFLNQLNDLEYNIILKKRYLKKEKDKEKQKIILKELEDLENKYYDIENEMLVKYSEWPAVSDPVKLMEETMEGKYGSLYPLLNHYKFGILYFAMNDNILYIIAFTKNNVQRVVVEFEAAELKAMKKNLTAIRTKVNYLGSKADFKQFAEELEELSDWLSKCVMTAEMKEILRDLEYLTIIPSGFLINYPLEIMKIDGEYLGIKYKMTREFNLKFVAEQLRDIVWHSKQRNPNLDRFIDEKDVIFIGNPNFEEYMVIDKSDIELYVVDKEKVVQSNEEYKERIAKNEEVYQEADCWLMDLGKTEVRDIAKLFKKEGIKYQSLVDAEVSKEKLLELLNDKVKIFHFAGHAVFDNENPQFSQLVLRNSKVLNPPEFQKYRFWQNPLIIFSACESGVSEVKSGDEPFGFLRFTKIMGARNIIFSLWPVFSEPTTELMIFFYGRLIAGYEIAEAMRYAREKVTQMIENGEGLWFFEEFPLLGWAPFSFIGFPFFAYNKEVGQ